MFFCKCKQIARLDALETWKTETVKDIELLLRQLGSVVWWTRALVITLLPLIAAAFGYLLIEAFGK